MDLLRELALASGRAVHREALIDRLWPEKDATAGANNLYRALHDLRRIVGDETVRLAHGLVHLAKSIWIDVDEFESAIRQADPESLAKGVELYRGDLLTDDPYSDEVAAKRLALRQRFVDGAVRLARHHLESDRHEAAIAVLRQIVSIDPAQEEVQRMLITALARAGRRHDALCQWTECVKTVRAQLAVEPSKETLELHRAIRSEAPSPSRERSIAWEHVAQMLLGNQTPPPIRGRSEAMSQLASFLSAGRGVLLITGDAGIGKTRLALEGARAASERGAVLLAGSGYDVSTLATQPGFEQTLLPHADRSTCWLIEDLHLADESTVHRFHHLSRACLHLPLMLVATCREEEVRPDSTLIALLARLRRERRARTIQLLPLDEKATGQQIADLRGRPAEEALLAWVLEMGEGNPLFTEELVRASGSGHSIPKELARTLHQRVARLGPETKRFFGTASVMGRRFDFETVRLASDLSIAVALDSLDRGLSARVVEEDGHRYRFRHQLIREALYQSLTHARRAHLVGALCQRGPDPREASRRRRDYAPIDHRARDAP